RDRRTFRVKPNRKRPLNHQKVSSLRNQEPVQGCLNRSLLDTIAETLNSEDVAPRSGGQWWPSIVRDILLRKLLRLSAERLYESLFGSNDHGFVAAGCLATAEAHWIRFL